MGALNSGEVAPDDPCATSRSYPGLNAAVRLRPDDVRARDSSAKTTTATPVGSPSSGTSVPERQVIPVRSAAGSAPPSSR
ncbi:hypothetical protein ACFPM0_05300 [Pseudonocardia sulfidoxydans]|uniref:hypothetical protein n=1 Tax=Pseudonocardia sulfidoxydans TaxID=54011 RepID=UPI00361BBA77